MERMLEKNVERECERDYWRERVLNEEECRGESVWSGEGCWKGKKMLEKVL